MGPRGRLEKRSVHRDRGVTRPGPNKIEGRPPSKQARGPGCNLAFKISALRSFILLRTLPFSYGTRVEKARFPRVCDSFFSFCTQVRTGNRAVHEKKTPPRASPSIFHFEVNKQTKQTKQNKPKQNKPKQNKPKQTKKKQNKTKTRRKTRRKKRIKKATRKEARRNPKCNLRARKKRRAGK